MRMMRICGSMRIDAHVKILMRINHKQRQKKTIIPYLISPSIYAVMHVLELDLAVESASHQYEWGNELSSVPKWPVYGRARPSRRAFVENSPSKARIFVILPVYMWFWARSEGIHHWEPAWELLLTFRWSFERLNISIHLILWCPPWPALLKNKFCSILTFLENLNKKKKF